MAEFTVTELLKQHGDDDKKKDKGFEKYSKASDSATKCALCNVDLMPEETSRTLKGERVCFDCEQAFPSKIRNSVAKQEVSCGYCKKTLEAQDTMLTNTGKHICQDCAKLYPSKVAGERKTWYHSKPMPKMYICTYCGSVVEKIWIYSADSGIKRCKDCVVSGAKDDPDVIGS